MALVLVSQGCSNKVSLPGQLERIELFLLQFWRLESKIKVSAASSASSLSVSLREEPFLASPLLRAAMGNDTRPLLVWSYITPVSASVCTQSSICLFCLWMPPNPILLMRPYLEPLYSDTTSAHICKDPMSK